MQERSELEAIIEANNVVIFSKTFCKYCQRAKSILSTYITESFLAIELDSDERGWQRTLTEMTGQHTVPSIWIGGKFIGGCESLATLHTQGELKRMIEQLSEETQIMSF